MEPGLVLYRRNFVPGASYFFTLTPRDRSSDILVRHATLLKLAFRGVRQERPFKIDAIVVLPEHLHCSGTPQATACSGSHDTGNTRYGTKKMSPGTWTTSTSIR